MRVLALLLLAGVAVAGDLRVQQHTKIAVENDFYRLTIDAARGGAIRSFVYKPFDANKEWIYPNGGGLLEDMIWQQRHPGELQDHPYEFRIVEQTAAVLRIQLWRTFAQPPYPGLVMRKELELRADSPAIRGRMTLENPTANDMFPGAWVQNRFFGGGNKGVPVSYRPSYLGIRMSYYENGRGIGDEFVRRPTAGWAVTFDRETGAGFLGLVDYNYLQQQYSCLPAYTMEFFFDRVLIRAGKSWTTDYLLVPVTGMTNCYYADAHVYITAEQAGDTVAFRVHPTTSAVGKTTLTVTAETPDRSAKLAEKTATFPMIAPGQSAALSVNIPGSGEQPVVVKLGVDVAGQRGEQEFQYSADAGFYHLQESAITYRAPVPRKVKPELRGNRDLKLKHAPGIQAFYAYGVWDELNRVREALRAIDPQAAFTDSVFRVATLGPELSQQPLLAEDLLGYDVVVLNNVGADALGEAGEIAVRQYVEAGGSLLVCGGLYSLGKSRWHESALADVLPLTTIPFWDLDRLPAFTPIDGDLGAVQWLQKPAALATDAEIRMRSGDRPLLVTGRFGKGRVAVWLGTPMGQPPPGVVPYWQSPAWLTAFTTVLTELLPEENR